MRTEACAPFALAPARPPDRSQRRPYKWFPDASRAGVSFLLRAPR